MLVQIIATAAGRALATGSQTLDEDFVGDAKVDDHRGGLAAFVEDVLEKDGLLRSPRVAVQDDSGAVEAVQAPRDNLIHQAVTGQLASLEKPRQFPARRGVGFGFCAQQVAGGDGGDAQPLAEQSRLRSLPATWRAE